MNREKLEKLLISVSRGNISVPEAIRSLESMPFKDLEWAILDHHRAVRRGFPEVIYGPGKSAGQLSVLITELIKQGGPVIATKVAPEKALRVISDLPHIEYHEVPMALTWTEGQACPRAVTAGFVAVVTAGTSDIPVAAEAALVLELMGHRVESVYDVGIAGVHRLFHKLDKLREASAIVCVAGMDGALPGLVASLVNSPVIAVPVSTGYGANFDGVAPLLTMLNSCSPGVSVVNIDNGFGAGVMAALINSKRT